ncbi:hypothetical protein [Paractinoplanes durhamensis]|uniref:SLATT domain-containing protein n=1 Tax=Paractinoplanes durhamensis TaxID=113563 RepID=A0ABQ3Z566_9ACTN|nr:hypothetical protein [Actinoplanes durhamensis]GIE04939.1 hypothetical protein Adu01nite_62890 [Actinoplanes durhamensis]
MTGPRRFRPVLPARAPAASDLAERDRFTELARESARAVRTSAEAWRNGLAAFITLVTTGVVLQGRNSVATLAVGWRVAATLLVAAGLTAAVAGLWQALTVQAGIPVAIALPEVRRRFGSLQALEIATAVRDARRLRLARRWVAAALALLLAGVVVTWWAPAAPAKPPGYVRVEHGSETTCGTLRSADGGVVRVAVAGRHDQVVIPLAAVANLTVVAACPPD